MKDKAIDILNGNRLMAIATLRRDSWPQATMVSYANEDILIYFIVSRQSQNLLTSSAMTASHRYRSRLSRPRHHPFCFDCCAGIGSPRPKAEGSRRQAAPWPSSGISQARTSGTWPLGGDARQSGNHHHPRLLQRLRSRRLADRWAGRSCGNDCSARRRLGLRNSSEACNLKSVPNLPVRIAKPAKLGHPPMHRAASQRHGFRPRPNGRLWP